MDFRTRKNKGFTLAEMLVVVAIIGVLVGIVSVSISNSLEKAREATDVANIRSTISKMQNALYTGEYISYSKLIKNGHTVIYTAPYDDEKFVGTTTVLTQGSDLLKMFVFSQQKVKGWQGGYTEVAGYPLSAANYNMFRILLNIKTGEVTIEDAVFTSKR